MNRYLFADATAFFGHQPEKQICDEGVALHLLDLTASPPSPKPFRRWSAMKEHVSQTIQSLECQEDRVFLVRSRADLERVRCDRRVGVYFSLQSPPEDVMPTVSQLQEMRSLGVLFMTLAYDTTNDYGSGFAEPGWLTDEGCELMQLCAEAGITIDLSHANHSTAADAVEHTMRRNLPPVVATHTSSYDLYPHPRNLPDEVLKGIVQTGGFVGVLSLTSFLHDGTRDDVESFVQAIDYVQNLCGYQHVVIGSDGYYTERLLEQWKEEHFRLTKELNPEDDIFGVIRWPDQPLRFNRPDRMVEVYKCLCTQVGTTRSRSACGEVLYGWLLDRVD